jgi:selenide,water dikinase
VLVGFESSDDAGVYRLTDGLALVQTVDIITPIVDDAFVFGRIAAANALSDVYAMGGTPLTCLNICCFPKEGIPKEQLQEILSGAMSVVEEAGAALMGGHTVNDPELKFGLSVTGRVDPAKMLRNTGARPGQAIVLGKPIGLGVVMNAARKGLADPAIVQRAIDSMTTLNRDASEAALRHGATAATDITGYAFAGHARGVAAGSGVELCVRFGDLPILPGALELHRGGVAVSQCASNRSNADDVLVFEGTLDAAEMDMLFDPQTSGGLLVTVPMSEGERLAAELRASGYPFAAVIGEVRASDRPILRVVS